jgi:hypothetical protein
MKMQLGKTYLVNHGNALGELRVLEESEKAVRVTNMPASSRNAVSGEWKLRPDIEAKVVEELKR